MVVHHVAYDVHLLAPQVAVGAFDGAWRALQVTCASTFWRWSGPATGSRTGAGGREG